MRLPDSVIVGTTVSMALSHCERANVTEGILLCSSESDLVKIATTILSARSIAAHPAAIGTIVCGFLADVLDYKIETSWAETYVLETASGQSGLLLAGGGGNLNTTVNVRMPESAYQLMTLRLHNAAGGYDTEANQLPVLQSGSSSSSSQAVPDATITLRTGMENLQDWEQQLALSRKSVGLAQLALAWETYSQRLVRLTKLVEKFLQTKTLTTMGNTDCNEDQLPVREQQRIAMQQQVDYLSQRAADLVARAGYLRGRLELQNIAVSACPGIRLIL